MDTLVSTPDGEIRFVDTAGMRRRAQEAEGAEYYSLVRALQSLEHLGGAKVTVLGEALGVPPSTASRISDRLTAAGLITREVAPDNRRATWLELTPAGRSVLSDLAGARAQALGRVTEVMSPEERDALLLGAEGFARAYDSLAEAGDDGSSSTPRR